MGIPIPTAALGVTDASADFNYELDGLTDDDGHSVAPLKDKQESSVPWWNNNIIKKPSLYADCIEIAY